MFFGPQCHVKVLASEVRLLGIEEVHEKFNKNAHYVGHVSNRLPLSFHVVVDCHKGYTFILRHVDETYAKPVWVARALSQQIL